jgi:hypothetical protein
MRRSARLADAGWFSRRAARCGKPCLSHATPSHGRLLLLLVVTGLRPTEEE